MTEQLNPIPTHLPRTTLRGTACPVQAGALYLVCLVFFAFTPSHAQVIDFESIPGEPNPQERLEISDQFLDSHGVSFELEGGGFPRLAEVGGEGTAFVGPGAEDQPEPGQGIGRFFLTDDGVLAQGPAPPLIVRYRDPTARASGLLIDVDFDERFIIQARDSSDSVVSTAVVEAGDPGTGDGRATLWTIERAEADISSIRIAGTREAGGRFGLAFDNFNTRQTLPESGEGLLSGAARPFVFDQQASPRLFNGDQGHYVVVPANASRLTIKMRRWRGQADVDLHVRNGVDVRAGDAVFADVSVTGDGADKTVVLERGGDVPLGPGTWFVALTVNPSSEAVAGTVEATLQTVDSVGGPPQVVPGSGNLWLAGAADGVEAGNDSAPANSPTHLDLSLQAGRAVQFSVEGQVELSNNRFHPEGNPGRGLREGDLNEIAGLEGPQHALAGVFLTDSPAAGPRPGNLDFSGDGLNIRFVQPLIGQPFLIGSGYTPEGDQRTFGIPDGATRLFVASFNRPNRNKSGEFRVRARVVDSSAGGANPIRVSARADLWDVDEDVLGGPALVDVQLVAGEELEFYAQGEIVDGREPFPVEGAGERSINTRRSISGIRGPSNGLIGVFLGAGTPSGDAPPTLDFRGDNSRPEFLQPELQQSFYVGSGLTAAGVPRKFVVPEGAARLYLAPLSYNDRDNSGSFSAVISRASANRPITSVEAATNSAGFGPAPLTPGSVMSLFGQGFGQLSGAETTPLPSSLAGTSVWFDLYRGALFFVSPEQINVQVPWELGTARSARMTVIRDGIASAAIDLPLEPFQPGVFTIAGLGPVVINNRTGGLVTQSEPARAGDALIVFTTGGGPVTAQPDTAATSPAGPLATGLFELEAVIAANGREVLVKPFFAGLAPGFVGVYQINLIVPAGLGGGEGTLRVQSAPFAASNTVTLYLAE